MKKRRARPSNPLDAESIKFSMIVENLDEEKLESSEGLKSDKLSILSSGRKRYCGVISFFFISFLSFLFI